MAKFALFHYYIFHICRISMDARHLTPDIEKICVFLFHNQSNYTLINFTDLLKKESLVSLIFSIFLSFYWFPSLIFIIATRNWCSAYFCILFLKIMKSDNIYRRLRKYITYHSFTIYCAIVYVKNFSWCFNTTLEINRMNVQGSRRIQ